MVTMALQAVLGVAVILTSSGFLWYYRKVRPHGAKRKGANKLLTDTNVKHELPLIESIQVSHNTRRFRFQLPQDTCLGLLPGQHINLSANINGSLVVRTYSPVTTDRDVGFMEIVVKVYFKDVHPQFPNGGKMSQFLNNLKPGETVHVRGPSGKMVYDVYAGEFIINANKKSPQRIIKASQINMIAGGSGITPMLQVLNAIFTGEQESQMQLKTSVSLIFANQTEDDILCRSYIEEILKKYPERLKIWYTLTAPPEEWHYGIGRINGEMFKMHLFSPSSTGIQLLCGPNPMISTCLEALMELGYDAERCYAY